MLDKRKSDLWNAMGLGPQWVERGSLPAEPAARSAANPAEAVSPNPPNPLSVPATAQPASDLKTARDPAPRAAVQGTPSSDRPAARREIRKTEQRIIRKAAAPESGLSLDSRGVSPEGFSEARRESIAKANWIELRQMADECRVCAISGGRLNPVFGEGEPKRRIMLIGEAPGAEEDKQGKPFVGPSGVLLNNILKAIGLDREKDLAVCNTLKCRPPLNATPEKSEMLACRPFLERQIELIDPDVIVAMGKPAAVWFFNEVRSLTPLRSHVHEFNVGGRTRKVIVTYHPSYLLRSPMEKRKAWMDWCLVLDTVQGLNSSEGNEI